MRTKKEQMAGDVKADTSPVGGLRLASLGVPVLANALVRIGEYVADHGLESEGPYQAARDLLLRHAPRVEGQPLRVAGETSLTAALRLALALDGGVLPTGSGKTYTGAHMIVAMVKAGLRVGVTANSHVSLAMKH
jgi:uncharacterized protein